MWSSNESLLNHYKTNFALIQHHKYSLSELEQMIPWEREVYVAMLSKWLKDENERLKQTRRKKGRSQKCKVHPGFEFWFPKKFLM